MLLVGGRSTEDRLILRPIGYTATQTHLPVGGNESFDFPGFPREFIWVWAPNGHPGGWATPLEVMGRPSEAACW